jgi:hypothetical protein
MLLDTAQVFTPHFIQEDAHYPVSILLELFLNLGAKQRQAFLDQMIQAVKNGASLTDQELQAEVDNIMLAVS